MKLRKSKSNKYVELVESKPGLILSCLGNKPSNEEMEVLKDKCSKFERVYCEFGSGSGGHLTAQATADPHGLYIGFELRYKRTFRTAEKAEKAKLKNVLVAKTDARKFGELFAEKSISGAFVNFPDPWSKKRWHKHRLISEEFLILLASRLHDNGFLSYKSDHEESFLATKNLVELSREFRIEKVTIDLLSSEWAEKNVVTEFESLFIGQGLPIYYLFATKQVPKL